MCVWGGGGGGGEVRRGRGRIRMTHGKSKSNRSETVRQRTAPPRKEDTQHRNSRARAGQAGGQAGGSPGTAYLSWPAVLVN